MKYVLLLILLCFSSCNNIFANQISMKDAMSEWKGLSIDSLRTIGNRCMLHTAGIDSAAICFMLIVNKAELDSKFRKEKQSQKILVSALNDLAYIYIYYYFDYAKAYSYLDEAETIAVNNGFNDMLPGIYLNRAHIYSMVDQNYRTKNFTDNTIDFYKKAFVGGVESENWKVTILAYNNLLTLALIEDKCEEISDVMHQFETLSIPEGTPLLHFTIQHHLGVEEYVKGNSDKAIEHFKDMANPIDISERPERKCLIASRNISAVCERTGDTDYGINTLLVAVMMAKTIGSTDLLPAFYDDLSKLYTLKQDSAKCSEYRIKSIIQRDSIFNQGHLKEITKMKFLGELQQADIQYRKLSYRKEIYKVVCYSLAFIVILLVVFFIYVYKSRAEVRKNYQEIYHKNEELMRLREEQRRYRSSPINEEMMNHLYDRIINVLDNSSDIYEEGFSLDRLAELTNTKPQYISEVFAEHNTTFYAILAEYRIQEACKRLTDVKNFGTYNIEGIGQSVGFKSRSNFSSTFKRVTGLTPGQYQNLSKNTSK